MELRRLTAADAEAFRRVRLEGLRESPIAFSSDYETEAARPIPDFAAQLLDRPDNFIIGAFVDGVLVGVGGLVCESMPKMRHKGSIRSVYVLSSHRGGGVGRRIMEEIISSVVATLPHVQQILLTATAVNARARELYVALGFQTWGREPRALLIDGQYYDDEHMVLFLQRGSAAR